MALVVYQRPQRPNWPLRLGRPWRFGRPGRPGRPCLLLSNVRLIPCPTGPRAAGQIARSGVATGFGAAGGTDGCLGGAADCAAGTRITHSSRARLYLELDDSSGNTRERRLVSVAIGLKLKPKHIREKSGNFYFIYFIFGFNLLELL